MAQRMIVELIDDLDGKDADETITFALDGVDYEIDLSGKNAAKMRDALAPFVDAARKTGGRKSKSKTKTSAMGGPTSGPDPAKVREWALGQGYDVANQGRVPRRIVEAYKAAGNS